MRIAKGYKRMIDNKINVFGETDLDKKIIKINKKKANKSKKAGVKGELIDSIVHEELHAKKPSASERKIIELTKKSIDKMSPKTKAKFYKLYSK